METNKTLQTIIDYIKSKPALTIGEASQILPMLESIKSGLTPKENANKRTTKKSN